MQCREIVDKTWGIEPSMMKWIYTAMIRPIMSYACVSWAGGLNKKYLLRKLTKVRRLACLIISSAFPCTPTGALEMWLNITPIEEFLLAEQCEGHAESLLVGSGMSTQLFFFGKRKDILMFAMRQENSYRCCKSQLIELRKQKYSREISHVKLRIKRMLWDLSAFSSRTLSRFTPMARN